MTTEWRFGPAETYWMEYDTPSYDAWHYMLDMDDVPQSTRDVLLLLDKLEILSFNCYYETTEQIRIKARNE